MTTTGGFLDLLGDPIPPRQLDAHGLLSHDDFELNCDPRFVKTYLHRFEKKVIGATLYVVRIEIAE